MREALIQIRAGSETALDEAFDRVTSVRRSGNPSEPVAVLHPGHQLVEPSRVAFHRSRICS
jgi:hypothetical protein